MQKQDTMRRNECRHHSASPEKVFLIIGTLSGILFLLITPPFQVPDEPRHFFRAFHVSEFCLLAQKLDLEKAPDAMFLVREDGRFIRYKAQEGGNSPAYRHVRDAVPVDVAERVMHFVRRTLETGTQQIFRFELHMNNEMHRYVARVIQSGNDEALVSVTDSTSVTEKVGAFLPKSLIITVNGVMGNVPFHPEEKQNIHEIFSLLKLPLDPAERSFAEFPNTALYSPLPYIPQASGIALGRIFNFSPLVLVYLGRIFNLSVWILLVYLAIHTTPVSKWLFFLSALMPMSLFQAASLSADCVTNGVSFLLISLFLRYSFGETESIRVADILVLLLCSLFLPLCKQVYFPLLFLFLLIPATKFGTKRNYWITFVLICLMSGATSVLWSSLAKGIYVPFPGRPAVPDQQIRFIAADPLHYFTVIARTFIHYGREYAEEFIGVLGCLDTKLPGILIASYLTVLTLAAIADNREDIRIGSKEKLLMVVVFLLSAVLISTSLYLLWTEVGRNIIEGIQGRYFIPIAPLLFLLFYNRKIHFYFRRFDLAILCHTLSVLTCTLGVLLKRYYL